LIDLKKGQSLYGKCRHEEGDRYIVVKLFALDSSDVCVCRVGHAAVCIMRYVICWISTTENQRQWHIQAEAVTGRPSRALMKVQFVTLPIMKECEWDFYVQTKFVGGGASRVKSPVNISFFARNTRQGSSMVAQAVPSITPTKAAEYFHKTECFCFNQQILEAGQDGGYAAGVHC
jgi:cytochrome c oxidase assembly protein Cox11